MSLILQGNSRKVESGRYLQWSLGTDTSSLLTSMFYFSSLKDDYAITIFYCTVVLDRCIMRYYTKFCACAHAWHTPSPQIMSAEFTRARISYFCFLNIQFPNHRCFSGFLLFHIKSIWHLHLLEKKICKLPFGIMIEIIETRIINGC